MTAANAPIVSAVRFVPIPVSVFASGLFLNAEAQLQRCFARVLAPPVRMTPCGLYRPDLQWLERSLGLPADEAAAGLCRLNEIGLVDYDAPANVLRVPYWWQYMGKANVVLFRYQLSFLAEIPECKPKLLYYAEAGVFAHQKGIKFAKAYEEAQYEPPEFDGQRELFARIEAVDKPVGNPVDNLVATGA